MAVLIQTPEELCSFCDPSNSRGNYLIGSVPELHNSKIVFGDGSRNILVCGEGVRLVDSTLSFRGSDCVIYLGSDNSALKLDVTVYYRNVFAIGKKAYTNGILHVIASERKSVLIGDRALFSWGIWIRTADPHLIYASETKRRINPSRDVIVGDHVWLGQSCMLLKGTVIGSGSIVGAAAVVAGKTIPSNTSWVGNPARQVSSGIFFDGSCVHGYTEEGTEASMVHETDEWVYGAPKVADASGQGNALTVLADMLGDLDDPFARVAAVRRVYEGEHDKNRFAIGEEPQEDPSGGCVGGTEENGLLDRLRNFLHKIGSVS